MEYMGMAGVAAISVIAWLVGEAVKLSPLEPDIYYYFALRGRPDRQAVQSLKAQRGEGVPTDSLFPHAGLLVLAKQASFRYNTYN